MGPRFAGRAEFTAQRPFLTSSESNASPLPLFISAPRPRRSHGRGTGPPICCPGRSRSAIDGIHRRSRTRMSSSIILRDCESNREGWPIAVGSIDPFVTPAMSSMGDERLETIDIRGNLSNWEGRGRSLGR
jgi:hypothetical protein